MKRIKFKAGLCQGCMTCVTFCSQKHTGIASPKLSRIIIDPGIFDGKHKATICIQCTKAKCVEVCPNKAISLSAEGTYWEINYDLCDGCGLCVENCPFNAMRYNSREEIPFKCDLCGGDPECVTVCPTNALTLIELSKTGGLNHDKK